jgi:hypothetical protein
MMAPTPNIMPKMPAPGPDPAPDSRMAVAIPPAIPIAAKQPPISRPIAADSAPYNLETDHTPMRRMTMQALTRVGGYARLRSR